MPDTAQCTRRAVIDVGTNSVKLLVADVTRDGIRPVFEASEQTRLGRGFYKSHLLQKEAIDLTASVILGFINQARELGASGVRPFATSAARDARNADELCLAIHNSCGSELTIISGETEAAWAFRGVSSSPSLSGKLFLLMDVGGGSTEFILGQGGLCHFSQSFPLGTVRTLEALPHGDPPKPEELIFCRESIGQFIKSQVQPVLEAALQKQQATAGVSALLAATGGTATILAAMELKLGKFDRERIEAARLGRERVTRWVNRLWSMPLVERRQIPGLPPPRADVMLAGAVIFEAVMQQLGFSELHVSTRGLRFAALQELWK